MEKYLEKYPELLTLFRAGYFRRYQVQEMLGLSKEDTSKLIMELFSAGYIKTTPFGYKLVDASLLEKEVI